MNAKGFLASAGALSLLIALIALGLTQPHKGGDVSALPASHYPATSHLAGHTVIVADALPVQSATGSALILARRPGQGQSRHWQLVHHRQ